MAITVYQTLEDRGSPEQIEDHGPIYCDNPENSWLGYGYYFWEHHIELAHWWGKAHCNNNYVICRSYMTIDEYILDLHNNGEHRDRFISYCNELVSKGISQEKDIFVPIVIEFMKKHQVFNYNAIRMTPADSLPVVYFEGQSVSNSLRFAKKSKVLLSLRPPTQVCFLKKDTTNRKSFEIVFPVSYIESIYV